MAKLKKILTIDDLVKFCEEQKFQHFSSANTGYQLAVKVPCTFEEELNDDNHRGMMKLKFRIFHTGLNRNGSFVSKEAAEKAMNTIADRPILAAIHQLNDGSWDFEGHEMEIITNDDGEEELRYIESQVGSFSSEKPFWEHDDELDKDYVCAYGYVSEEYTKAAEIIKAKNGTKNSCELFIDELAYNAKERYLDLIDFYVNASTLLGSKDDGTEIGEGMVGSRADIADFSTENNSVHFEQDENIIKILQELSDKIDNLSSYTKDSMKGGQDQVKFEELLKKYNKTAEDITFDVEGLSDEELEAAFEEAFGEGDDSVDNEPEATLEQNSTDDSECSDGESDNADDEESSEGQTTSEIEQEEKFTKTFSISHEDIKAALYALIAPMEEIDNEWYWISAVYDDSFVYEAYFGGSIYGQKYSKDGDNVVLDGERYALHVEYLTDSEYAALNEMRSNYSQFEEISAKLAKYESEPEKLEIINHEDYAQISETEEFKSFAKKDAHFDLSVEEVKSKMDDMLLEFAKKGTLNFSSVEKSKESKNMNLPTDKKKVNRYGTLFSGGK